MVTSKQHAARICQNFLSFRAVEFYDIGAGFTFAANYENTHNLFPMKDRITLLCKRIATFHCKYMISLALNVLKLP